MAPVAPAHSPTPLPHLRPRKGLGGAGLPPLGTAVAQSISPKPRKIFITKKQKKKKKQASPVAPFPPCPQDSRDWLWGAPGRVGALGAGHSGKSGGGRWGPPSARPALPSSAHPPVPHQRWPFPDPARGCCRGPGAGGWPGPAVGGGSSWQRRAGLWPPHTVPSAAPPTPRAGHSLHKLLWGLCPPPQVCAILPYSPGGGDRREGMAPCTPYPGPGGARPPPSGGEPLSRSAAPHTIPTAPLIGINLGTATPHPPTHHSSLGLAFSS